MPLLIADVVWPALFLSMRLTASWCIALSLLLEAAALWRYARIPPLKSLAASALMNVVSALVGYILIPVAGLHFEEIAHRTYNAWFGWGTFNLVTEAATWVLAVGLSTALEVLVLWLVFLMPWTRRTTLVVLAANAVTVALAWITLAFSVPQ